MSKVAEPASSSERFPAGIPFIVGNEGAERFSFYGMKAILYIYLTSLYVRFVGEAAVPAADMAAAKAHGTEVVHLFIAGVYLFPLVGAVVADRLLGKFRLILWVSLVYCAGHGVLAVAGRMGAMGQFGSAEWLAYTGLGLIALGSGGIKPCVSANVGDQFTAANGHLVTIVFQIFYFIINYGSFFSTLLTPKLYEWYGPEVAFGVPGVLMGIATVVFWSGRDRFIQIPPKPGGRLGLLDACTTVLLLSPLFALIGLLKLGATAKTLAPIVAAVVACVGLGLFLFRTRQKIQRDSGFLAVTLWAIRNQKRRRPGEGFFSVAKEEFGEEAAEGPPAVFGIVKVFAMVSVFWALFDQHSSTWVEQAKQMNLNLTVPATLGSYGLVATILLSLGGGVWLMLWVSNVRASPRFIRGVLWAALGGLVVAGLVDAGRRETVTVALQASQLASLNPLMVMLIIPLLNVAVYAPLAKREITIRPLQKMTAGMFLAAASFALAALLQTAIESSGPGNVHALWQAVPYFVITIAEVLVSVTGLEFAYTQAPRPMKSTMMGFWLLCVTFGNLLVAFLAPLQKAFPLSVFFWVFVGLMCVAAAVFAFMARRYKGKTYLQPASGH